MAALAAAESGARVILVERQPLAGRKLAATGGGRCNLTNALDPETFMLRFGPQGRFMGPALARFGRDQLLAWMRDAGVPCETTDGFHYFPASQRALDVTHALLNRLQARGVELRLNAEAESLEIGSGQVRGVRLNGSVLPADAVIVAAGGAAWPSLGGCSRGYELARQAGHTIQEPAPALTGLTSAEPWPTACAGVTLPDTEAWIDLPARRKTVWRGTLLFTHAGLSGPVILDLSGAVAVLLRDGAPVPLRLRALPDMAAADWKARFEAWRADRGRKSLRNCLDESLPHSLAQAACTCCAIEPEARASGLTAEARDRLADWLAGMPVTIPDPPGFSRAMVTRGGVTLREVNPKTLESRLAKGLFWAGEVLDLDGPCGGYNLQWAFSSGRLAGETAAGSAS
jgi:predicted Rossmann fold flavoprotein